MSSPGRYYWMIIRTTTVLVVLLSLVAESSSALAAGTSPIAPFLADCSFPCLENFDNITPPALPSGWTTTVQTGQPGDQPWLTTTAERSSPPNSVFVNAATHITDIRLDSPAIPIGLSGAVLTFKRQQNLESDFDGMVLEISIPSVAGGAFQDIIKAGGAFTEGGYNDFIGPFIFNPLAGRDAWSDRNFGFQTTSVKLPNSAKGQSVTFRWRVGTNNSGQEVGTAFIDSIELILPPPNDNFSSPQPILGRLGIIHGSNVAATKEAGEANHADSTGGASVWYKWQAPEDGRFVFTTFGSDFETVIAVYTGSSLPNTSTIPVASNSIEPSGCLGSFGSLPSDSRVAFDAVGGVFYRIAVDVRSNRNGGNIVLRWGASATITGRISDVSGRSALLSPIVELQGDACRRTEGTGAVLFTDVPKGHNYKIDPQAPSPFVANFTRWGTTEKISPLTGDVSNYNFYQSSPTVSITSTVTILGGDRTGLKVTCVSKALGADATVPVDFVITKDATDLGNGQYQCGSLPIGGDWVVTPSKLGFTFTPPSKTFIRLTVDISPLITPASVPNFVGTAAPARTISGRVTLPGGTTGVSGVTMALTGSQADSKVTDANGNYSFTGILQGGNYTVTASNANFTFTPPNSSFNNLTADQTASFTASFLLQLILEESGQVAALDAVLLTRDPFAVVTNNVLYPDVDRHTRVVVFVPNLVLGPGELPSSVKIDLVGSNGQMYEISAEDVRPSSVSPFTQITFKLPDDLASGICTLAVKAHGLTSNIGAITIKP